jgi:hypothetical protein
MNTNTENEIETVDKNINTLDKNVNTEARAREGERGSARTAEPCRPL